MVSKQTNCFHYNSTSTNNITKIIGHALPVRKGAGIFPLHVHSGSTRPYEEHEVVKMRTSADLKSFETGQNRNSSMRTADNHTSESLLFDPHQLVNCQAASRASIR